MIKSLKQNPEGGRQEGISKKYVIKILKIYAFFNNFLTKVTL
jgi:hypothetical protein